VKYLKWNLSFILLTNFQFGRPEFKKKKIIGLLIAILLNADLKEAGNICGIQILYVIIIFL
jgi:hypothetical protein